MRRNIINRLSKFTVEWEKLLMQSFIDV
jgi:hypothetical protein